MPHPDAARHPQQSLIIERIYQPNPERAAKALLVLLERGQKEPAAALQDSTPWSDRRPTLEDR